MEQNKEKKRKIGQCVARIALAADPSLKNKPSTVGNWKQGISLPRLEEFLGYCKATNTTDISFILNQIGS